jgi:hypothetical protein
MAVNNETVRYDLPPAIWNLYVVKLNNDASRNNHRSAPYDNDRKNKGQCVYVGCTMLAPSEKLRHHKGDSSPYKNVRPSYYESLMPDLFTHLNIGDERGLETYLQVTKRELKLAKELESEGYIVWCYTR